MAGRCACVELGADGAAAAGTNCLRILGAGVPANPFVLSAVISPAEGNIVTCEATGLYATAPADKIRIFAVDGTVSGGAAPDPATYADWLLQAETNVGVSAAGGFADVEYPDPFPGGVLTVVPVLGDREPSTGAYIAIDQVQSTNNHFVIVVTDAAGVGVDGAIRINWVAIGW